LEHRKSRFLPLVEEANDTTKVSLSGLAFVRFKTKTELSLHRLLLYFAKAPLLFMTRISSLGVLLLVELFL